MNMPPKESLAHIGLFPSEQELITKFFPLPPAKILDIGFGYGRELVPLDEMGYDIDAIEIIPEAIAHVKATYPLRARLQEMSAEHLMFSEAKFDAVLFPFNGIDYLFPESSRDRAIAEMYRVLKPGGIALLTSHNWLPFLVRPNMRRLEALSSKLRSRLPHHYFRWQNEEGMLTMYAALPMGQRRHFMSFGFEVLQVYAKGRTQSSWITFNAAWPYYVLRKPIVP